MSDALEYAKHFEYLDGGLYWKHNRGSQLCKGKLAGTSNNKGYVMVRIRELGNAFGAHRIIFAMHHGYVPEFVDHIDGNPSNNRIENLRPATRAENNRNQKIATHNKSGLKNVSWNKARNKWSVHLSVNNIKQFFGLYEDIELADLVAMEARNKYHGSFANHGAQYV